MPSLVMGQSFAPEPGVSGSTAIHKDSTIIVDWATDISVSRGYANVSNPSAGFVTYGNEQDAIGPADGTSVVSLGDGGEAIIYFGAPLFNGPGPDFAIFENGFIDHYMEFAFVEVSSDGVNFVRFDAISETPTDTQLNNFSISDCRYVHNLAGKYRQSWGTPFDLDELVGAANLDVNNVNYLRLIDVVGSVDTLYGSLDSQGNLINDPFPTEFESGGFDLDAVGVIHQLVVGISEQTLKVFVAPNPTEGIFKVSTEEKLEMRIRDANGLLIEKRTIEGEMLIDLTNYPGGLYFCELKSELDVIHIKLLKL